MSEDSHTRSLGQQPTTLDQGLLGKEEWGVCLACVQESWVEFRYLSSGRQKTQGFALCPGGATEVTKQPILSPSAAHPQSASEQSKTSGGTPPFPPPGNPLLLILPPWIQGEHGYWHVGLTQTKTDVSGGPRPDTLGPASLSSPPHLPLPTLMWFWFLHLHLHPVTRRSCHTRCASVAPPQAFSAPSALCVPVIHFHPGDLALVQLLKCHRLCRVSFDLC